MKVLRWNNPGVGDYDLFVIINGEELRKLKKQFESDDVVSISMEGYDEYFYFVNSIKKTITPMPLLSLAFGGQYNAYPPYSDDSEVEFVDFEGYRIVPYKSRHFSTK